jgi:pimeloyl-ACP methyl ester carboxylesterase
MSHPATLQPQFTNANGVEFAYLHAGEGPLVLCLHGFPDTAWSFADLLRRLADSGYRAVAPFMRGYAPSAIPEDRDYSCTALGRDVIALVEHLGADKAIVVGHDWGAIAGYVAAAMRPDRIGRIVSAGVPHLRRLALRPSGRQMRASTYVLRLQLPSLAERHIRELDYAWLWNLVRSWSPGWELPQEYVVQVRAAFADPLRLKAALGYYRAIPRLLFARDAWQYLLQPTPVPAKVIFGGRDGCLLPAMFQDMQHLFAAEFELSAMPQVGHFMHLEAPAAFAEQVLEFVGRRSA